MKRANLKKKTIKMQKKPKRKMQKVMIQVGLMLMAHLENGRRTLMMRTRN